MPNDAQRVQSVFLAALEIADPAERARFVDGACDGDTGLQSRVEALLRAHDQPDSLLDHATVPPHVPNSANTRTIDHEGDAATDDEAPLGFLAPTTRPDSLGRIGHYEVLQVLGQGGFGIVFRGFDDALQRVVAVKVLTPQMAATSPARKRFLREARSSAQVRHENVVQVYEVGEQPLPYIAMEFIPGETLQQRLDRTGPIEVADVVRIGRQIAEGLAAAHATELIHRDIKPANVLLEGGTQRVKITDFGLARAADDASISHSGLVAGTPMYMAPEQAKGETLDQRADLFSFGSVLYVMATGRPPFRANGTLAVLKRVAEDQPRAIREVIPETPQWLCDIIAKLHAKNPDDRYQSAREVADVLADCEAQLKANAKLKDFSRIPWSTQSGAGAGGRLKWVAAAALLLPVIALALAEIAGVTHLVQGRAALDSVQPFSWSAAIAEAPATGKTPATSTNNPDRRAAEFVLSGGGTVKVNGQEQEIHVVAELPREPFRLTSVDLHFLPAADDAGLDSFEGCKNLVRLNLYTNSLLSSTRFTDAGLAYFKDCKNLTSLSLGSEGVTDAGLLHFQDCKNLTSLSLGCTGVTDAGLLHFKEYKNLTILEVSNAAATGAGLAPLRGFNHLTQLRLFHGRFTDAGLAHFKGYAKLTHLTLTSAGITDAGVIHFEDCKNLIDLDFGDTQVSDAGIAAFVDCKNLKKLSLRNTPVSDVGLAQLKDCKGLRVLDLGWSKVVTAQGIKGLAKALPSCAIMWGDGVIGPNNGLDRRAAEHVLAIGGVVEIDPGGEIKAPVKLPATAFRLTRVGLGDNLEVTDAGLGEFKGRQNLNVLDLTNTLVTNAGLVQLAGLSGLTDLLLAKTEVTAKGVERLARSLPNCKITWDGGVIGPK